MNTYVIRSLSILIIISLLLNIFIPISLATIGNETENSNEVTNVTEEVKDNEVNDVIEEPENNEVDIENVNDDMNTIVDKEDNQDKNLESDTDNDVIEGIETVEQDSTNLFSTNSQTLGVSYRTHVENIGWQDWKENGEMSGTSGMSYRLEGINIQLIGPSTGLKIKYQVHVENIGWQDWKTDGEMAGTSGMGYRLEGIKIQLEGTEDYSVQYRVHVQDIGWQDWKTDGEMAGTSGKGLRLEGIEIKIVPKVKRAKIEIETPENESRYYEETSVKVKGWKMANIANTTMKAYIDNTPINSSLITYQNRNDIISSLEGYGTSIQNPTPGFEFTLDITSMSEGLHKIKIVLYSQNNEVLEEATTVIIIDRGLHAIYSSHMQSVGWQQYMLEGYTSGVPGGGLRTEAMKIKLVNAPVGGRIVYRTHVENIGWQNWVSNDEIAGTSGQSLRIEGLQIYLENMENYTVQYKVYVQGSGWTDWSIDGETAGSFGKGLRLEGVIIQLVPKIKKATMKIETPVNETRYYEERTVKVKGWKMANMVNTTIKAYIDNSTTPIDSNLITYQDRNDIISSIEGYGTSFQNTKPGFEFTLDITSMSEGLHKIKVVLYSQNNEVLKEETITIIIDRGLHIIYNSHMQSIGWQQYMLEGYISGSPGSGLRTEAMKMKLVNAPAGAKIVYRTHVENIGWQNWVSNDEMAGTSGQSLRIEALQIYLENMENYTVEYKVYIQGIGWTDWYIDGETAGTLGQGRRIEAFIARLTSKYKRQYYGIDVSSFNGNINWALVKRDGVEFAMIRIGYRGYGQAGNFGYDKKFIDNITEAKRAGIPVGVYFVTQAITPEEAIEEANWVIKILRDNNLTLDYPIALDIEAPGLERPTDVPRTANLDKWTRTHLARLFCITIQNNGYTPMIYTNVNWAYNYLVMSELANYDTWIAHYKNNMNSKPDYNGPYAMWQHTSSGTINGILGRVDKNICYKKY